MMMVMTSNDKTNRKRKFNYTLILYFRVNLFLCIYFFSQCFLCSFFQYFSSTLWSSIANKHKHNEATKKAIQLLSNERRYDQAIEVKSVSEKIHIVIFSSAGRGNKFAHKISVLYTHGRAGGRSHTNHTRLPSITITITNWIHNPIKNVNFIWIWLNVMFIGPTFFETVSNSRYMH